MKVFLQVKFGSLLSLAALLASIAVIHAEAQQSGANCVLSSVSNGKIITIQGTVRHEPHDLAFDVYNCNETILLTYAGRQDNDISSASLRRDKNMKLFRKYTYSTYKSRRNYICIDCFKYDVEAELTGKLEIATLPPGATKDNENIIRDSSGTIIGIFGWGHPGPYIYSRFIIQSVSKVKARKLPQS